MLDLINSSSAYGIFRPDRKNGIRLTNDHSEEFSRSRIGIRYRFQPPGRTPSRIRHDLRPYERMRLIRERGILTAFRQLKPSRVRRTGHKERSL